MSAIQTPPQPQTKTKAPKSSVVQKVEIPGARVEVIEYATLGGSTNSTAAQRLYYAAQVGMHLRQVRIRMENQRAILEPGALNYMRGQLDLDSVIAGDGNGIGKALARKMLSSETMSHTHIEGTGEILLDPSFGHYLLLPMAGESYNIDSGSFFAALGGVTVDAEMQKNVSAALFGGEGLFQTKVAGEGLCVISLPVPADEVRCVELNGDKLYVDGSFAIMRTAGVEFSVKRSAKTLVKSMRSGEGLLQTFEGHGKVWIAPTQPVYDEMGAGFSGLAVSR